MTLQRCVIAFNLPIRPRNQFSALTQFFKWEWLKWIIFVLALLLDVILSSVMTDTPEMVSMHTRTPIESDCGARRVNNSLPAWLPNVGRHRYQRGLCQSW